MAGITDFLTNVYIALINNEDISKLLFYPSDNSNDDPLLKPNLSIEEKFEVLKRVSITEELRELKESDVKRGVCSVYLRGSESSYNPITPKRVVRFEIHMPVRKFEEVSYRTSKVVELLDELVLQRKFNGGLGIPTLSASDDSGQVINGYVSYYHEYNVPDVRNGKL